MISGIPEIQGERPLDTLGRISRALSFTFGSNDVDTCHNLYRRFGTNGSQQSWTFIILIRTQRCEDSILNPLQKDETDAEVFRRAKRMKDLRQRASNQIKYRAKKIRDGQAQTDRLYDRFSRLHNKFLIILYFKNVFKILKY